MSEPVLDIPGTPPAAVRNPRGSRKQDTRASAQRMEYAPPSALPTPDPQPGWSFRWIATHVLGKDDPSNVSRKFREGWVPVKASDHPELNLRGNASGNVEVGGLVLCKLPEEAVQARRRYYDGMVGKQLQSIDTALAQNAQPHRHMPLFNNSRAEVSRFGNGS